MRVATLAVLVSLAQPVCAVTAHLNGTPLGGVVTASGAYRFEALSLDRPPLTAHWTLDGIQTDLDSALPLEGTVSGDGPHTVSVYVTDGDGNSSLTNSRTWTVDTVPPAGLAVTGTPVGDDPSSVPTAFDRTFALSASCTDATEVHYTWSLNGETAYRHTGATLSSPCPYMRVPYAVRGTNTLVVTATDAAGNASSVTRRWVVELPQATAVFEDASFTYDSTEKNVSIRSIDGHSPQEALLRGYKVRYRRVGEAEWRWRRLGSWDCGGYLDAGTDVLVESEVLSDDRAPLTVTNRLTIARRPYTVRAGDVIVDWLGKVPAEGTLRPQSDIVNGAFRDRVAEVDFVYTNATAAELDGLPFDNRVYYDMVTTNPAASRPVVIRGPDGSDRTANYVLAFAPGAFQKAIQRKGDVLNPNFGFTAPSGFILYDGETETFSQTTNDYTKLYDRGIYFQPRCPTNAAYAAVPERPVTQQDVETAARNIRRWPAGWAYQGSGRVPAAQQVTYGPDGSIIRPETPVLLPNWAVVYTNAARGTSAILVFATNTCNHPLLCEIGYDGIGRFEDGAYLSETCKRVDPAVDYRIHVWWKPLPKGVPARDKGTALNVAEPIMPEYESPADGQTAEDVRLGHRLRWGALLQYEAVSAASSGEPARTGVPATAHAVLALLAAAGAGAVFYRRR